MFFKYYWTNQANEEPVSIKKYSNIWHQGDGHRTKRLSYEAYPSHHLDAMRSITSPKFILLDEADFFPPGQQQDARDVSDRYIA